MNLDLVLQEFGKDVNFSFNLEIDFLFVVSDDKTEPGIEILNSIIVFHFD